LKRLLLLILILAVMAAALPEVRRWLRSQGMA
jgi:hypothetical protein